MSKKLENEIIEAIKKVFDPEIPVNIYELGLIYNIDIEKDGSVEIEMTLHLLFVQSLAHFQKKLQQGLLK